MWRTPFWAHSTLQGLGVLIDALSQPPPQASCRRGMLRNWSVYQAQIEHGLQDRVQLHLDSPRQPRAGVHAGLRQRGASLPGCFPERGHSVGPAPRNVWWRLTLETWGRASCQPDRPFGSTDQPAALAKALSAPWYAQPADQAMAFKALKEKFSWSAWATQLTQLVQSEVP